jgi:hypothetical protein
MIMTFKKISFSLLLLPALFVVLASAVSAPAATARHAQKSFASPEEAVKSFIEAVRGNDSKAILAILGPGARDIISSGDPVDDKSVREGFVKRYEEKNSIEGAESGRAVLSVGNEDSPFPIPLVKKGNVWRFDTRAGKEELLNRRIGRNELAVIEVLRAYVDAQREYVAKDRDGNGTTEFAQKFRSAPGKKDGLYWAAKEGEEESPMGPFAAKAAKEGYSKESTAFHGYHYRILKAQGKDAEGGAFDYLVKGKMILGFAVVAYPAKYGNSGIMTFIVNQNGNVFQKNLGRKTSTIASSMKLFNPDPSWKKVE